MRNWLRLKPSAGRGSGKVDQAGREVLKKAGVRCLLHPLHRARSGNEIHEQPRIAKGQMAALEPGMVITIEPGIYIPDDGGVRIEDMVLVTQSG